jgi:hypothetical protein
MRGREHIENVKKHSAAARRALKQFRAIDPESPLFATELEQLESMHRRFK